jgi:hypothetical protein
VLIGSVPGSLKLMALILHLLRRSKNCIHVKARLASRTAQLKAKRHILKSRRIVTILVAALGLELTMTEWLC